MTRTTPPRPLDVERVFPEVAPFRREAVRLHPRAGEPTVWDSSVGGPLLWPEGEAWPTCPEHADVLAPVLQVFRADTLGALDFPPGATLLQLLWCQSDDHADGRVLPLVLWRDASAVRVPLAAPPKPKSLQRNLIPRPCAVHPELVVEYPSAELPDDARDDERIDRVAAETGWDYDADLSVAPGTKLLGYPLRTSTPPSPTPDWRSATWARSTCSSARPAPTGLPRTGRTAGDPSSGCSTSGGRPALRTGGSPTSAVTCRAPCTSTWRHTWPARAGPVTGGIRCPARTRCKPPCAGGA